MDSKRKIPFRITIYSADGKVQQTADMTHERMARAVLRYILRQRPTMRGTIFNSVDRQIITEEEGTSYHPIPHG